MVAEGAKMGGYIDIASGVINAYLRGRQLRQRNIEQQQRRELMQQQLEQQQKQFEQNLDMRQKMFDVETRFKKLESQMAIRRALAEGILPGQPVMDSPDEVSVNIPELGGEVRGPSSQAVARRKKTLLEPEIEAKVSTAVKTAEGLAPIKKRADEEAVERQKAVLKFKSDLDKNNIEALERVRQAGRKELLNMRMKSEIDAIHLRGRYAKEVAKIRKADDVTLDEESIGNFIRDSAAGVNTLEEWPKLGLNQGQRLVVTENMQNRGLQPLDNKTRDQLTVLSPQGKLRAYLESFKTIAAQLQANPERYFNPLDSIHDAIGRLKSQLPLLASDVTFGGQKGALSQKDVDAMQSYSVRLRGILNPKVFIETANDFEERLTRSTEVLLKKYKEPQRKLLRETFDLINPYGGDLSVRDTKK